MTEKRDKLLLRKVACPFFLTASGDTGFTEAILGDFVLGWLRNKNNVPPDCFGTLSSLWS